MPLTHFLTMMMMVLIAAGLTLLLAFWLHVPMLALAFAALVGSLLMGARQWG